MFTEALLVELFASILRAFEQFLVECTKIARFSMVAAAIFTAPGKIARLVEAQDARFPLKNRQQTAIFSAMKTGKNYSHCRSPCDTLVCSENR